MQVFIHGNPLLEYMADKGDIVVVDGDEDASRTNLARWLSNYAAVQDCNVTLYFEGGPGGATVSPVEHIGRTEVVTLEPGESLRQAIAGPANRAAGKERTYVVTTDPKLETALLKSDARVYEPRKFLSKARTLMRGDGENRVEEPDQKFTGVPEEEVDFWAEMFEDDKEN